MILKLFILYICAYGYKKAKFYADIKFSEKVERKKEAPNYLLKIFFSNRNRSEKTSTFLHLDGQ